MGKRKNVIKKGVLLGGLALFLLFAKNETRAAEEEKLPDAAVVFQDENLERLVRDSLSIYDREIRQSDIADVTSIQLENHNIKDITGLENFKNLKKLDMSGNVIEDIQPLASLQMKLTTLQGLQHFWGFAKVISPCTCRNAGMWAFYYQKLLFTEKTNILEKVTQTSQNSFEKYLFFLKTPLKKLQ